MTFPQLLKNLKLLPFAAAFLIYFSLGLFIFLGLFTFKTFTPEVFAAVGVSSAELQEAASIIVPSGNSIETLPGYSNFSLQNLTTISGGSIATYEARLQSDPWLSSEIPNLQLMTIAYTDQATALASYEDILNSSYFKSSRDLHWHDAKTLFYESDTSSSADVFGTIRSEGISLHVLHVNGNILYQASLFKEDGEYNSNNIAAFTSAMQEENSVAVILEEVINSSKLALGILFPPTSTELSTKSSKSSLNLSELYEIPQHGTISFDLYVSELTGALGTILDSSGISEADEGDLYLYLGSDGKLYAGIYAPLLDANCTQQSGWYRINTNESVFAYEWNNIEFHFGVGGFSISLNGETEVSCNVSQARSENDFYFGDFPGDSINESMIGYVQNLLFESSETSTGLIWDEVLAEQLFLDLANTDPDVDAFQFLKDAGVFSGSDGMLYPDEDLNRAEMVKVLLKAYEYNVADSNYALFWDVPEDAWYLKYLIKAYEVGMVEGNPDGSFEPNSKLNRAEFYMMLYRIADPGKISYNNDYFDVNGSEWYAPAAAFAASQDLVLSSYFVPDFTVTRREAAKVLYALLR